MVLSEQLGEIDACNIVGSVQSMSNLDILAEILTQANFQIQSTQLMGIHYEVTAKRV